MSLETLLDLSAPVSTDEEELRWYFRVARKATGAPPSNFEAMLHRLWSGLTGHLQLLPDEQVHDGERARRIERALYACGPRMRAVLEACLGEDAAPELEVYGMFAGLVVRMPEAIAAHRFSRAGEDLKSWLGRLPRRARDAPAAKILLEDLMRTANRDFVQSLLVYRDAKRRLGHTRS